MVILLCDISEKPKDSWAQDGATNLPKQAQFGCRAEGFGGRGVGDRGQCFKGQFPYNECSKQCL